MKRSMEETLQLIDASPLNVDDYHFSEYLSSCNTHDICSELCKRMCALLRRVVQDLRNAVLSLSGSSLLEFHKRAWSLYESLQRNVCVSQLELHHCSLLPKPKPALLRSLIARIWVQNFYEQVNENITAALLDLTEQIRNGDVIDRTLIESVFSSYSFLGNPHCRRDGPDVYIKELHEKILAQTTAYYQKKSHKFLQRYSFNDYMTQVEDWLRSEQQIICTVLAPFGINTLEMCRTALIKDHLEAFRIEFPHLLQKSEMHRLSCFYSLISQCSDALDNIQDLLAHEIHRRFALLKNEAQTRGLVYLEVMNSTYKQIEAFAGSYTTNLETVKRVVVEILESYFYEQGLEAVDNYKDAAISDPGIVVRAFLESRKQLRSMLHSCPRFYSMDICVENACKKLLNESALASSKPGGAPELVAQHLDTLLRRSKYDELNSVIIIVQYLGDKDAFAKLFRILFTKRFLSRHFNVEDRVLDFFITLKRSYGIESMKHFQHMFMDVRNFQILNKEFRETPTYVDDHGFDFSVCILRLGAWPIAPQTTMCTLPFILDRTLESFAAFYRNKYRNQKLLWLYETSKGVLTTNCFRRRYVLQATTLQMAILLQFNDSESIGVQQLHQSTRLDLNVLQYVVNSLLKEKLLLYSGESDFSTADLKSDAFISLNSEYTNKKAVINIAQGVKLKPEVKRAETEARADNSIDRKNAIEAVIMKVMKAHRTLQHDDLIAKVLGQIVCFMPTIATIRSCIENLLVRDFIGRCTQNENTYHYVP